MDVIILLLRSSAFSPFVSSPFRYSPIYISRLFQSSPSSSALIPVNSQSWRLSGTKEMARYDEAPTWPDPMNLSSSLIHEPKGGHQCRENEIFSVNLESRGLQVPCPCHGISTTLLPRITSSILHRWHVPSLPTHAINGGSPALLSQPKGEEKERERDRRTQKWEEVSRLPGLLPASSSGRSAETKKLMASRSTRRGRYGRATRTEAAGLASRTWM
ncbi:hypothetical protein C4D60_Mb04t12700 [Musa balbisiana]|uniref:Uncharacterized protein n=1 Tax=Musa balbisiana TaxID=52838 RepID=A0A4S8KBJ7_MUSBA|nr:hypothetical protein C4D60_Mb04t12700 [Musa balbisiana]